jgi:D-alanyl-D-alanine dipeptidase
MKKLLRKTIFITIVVFMIFVIVASDKIAHRQLTTEILQQNDCLRADLVGHNQELSQFCQDVSQKAIIPSPLPSPSLNLNLPDKERFLETITSKLSAIPQPGTFDYILLRAYGAAFVDENPQIKLPPKVVFDNEQETEEFQATLAMGKVSNTNDCYLQKSAADALNRARSQIPIPLKSGYGAGDCTRSFETNLRFWRKYANDKTLEKVRQGKDTAILGLVAPPGSSQHLWGLAIDLRVTTVAQKQALNQNGWFQTVEHDIPHWTYIGDPQEKLVEFGLKNKVLRGITYWLTPL